MNQNDAAIMDVLHVVERGTEAFEAARTAVDIVCAGDSLTGWNNFGPAEQWPYRTYPDFLQELCIPLGLRVANGGIGEISDNGPQQVRDDLDVFPNARFFIIGMGTNDLGTWPDTEFTSRRIIGNLSRMAQMVRDRGKQPVLYNVPPVNERMFPFRIAREVYGKLECQIVIDHRVCAGVARRGRESGKDIRAFLQQTAAGVVGRQLEIVLGGVAHPVSKPASSCGGRGFP